MKILKKFTSGQDLKVKVYSVKSGQIRALISVESGRWARILDEDGQQMSFTSVKDAVKTINEMNYSNGDSVF